MLQEVRRMKREGGLQVSIELLCLAIPLNHVHQHKKKKNDISNNKVYECQTKDDIS